jgi:hypothetical protein
MLPIKIWDKINTRARAIIIEINQFICNRFNSFQSSCNFLQNELVSAGPILCRNARPHQRINGRAQGGLEGIAGMLQLVQYGFHVGEAQSTRRIVHSELQQQVLAVLQESAIAHSTIHYRF